MFSAHHEEVLSQTCLGDLEQLLSAKLLEALLDLSHSFPDSPEGEVRVHRHFGYEAVISGGAEVVEVLMGKESVSMRTNQYT